MRVLIIDDDEVSTHFISKVLTKDFNADIRCSTSGEEGLLQLLSSKENFDLIILDIMMSNMNGIETCLRIRENPQFKSIPIIIISSSLDKNNLLNSIFAGGNEFIRKPLDRAELSARVQLTLSRCQEVDQQQQYIKRQSALIKRLSTSFQRISGLMPYDIKTSLYTRTHMEQLLEREWSRHRRTQTTLGLILIQVDHLNSEYQKEFIRMLEHTCKRASDHLGIWTEDTFIGLISDSKKESHIKVSNLIQKASIQKPEFPCYLGVSGCIPPINTGKGADLLEGAQSALLDSRKQGPGLVVFKEVTFSQIQKKPA